MAGAESLDRAEQHLRRALELDANYVQARYNLGLIFHRRAQAAEAGEERERLYRLAVVEFGKAVVTRDDHFESQLALGTDLCVLDRFAEAVTPFRRAEQLRPYDARPAKELAEALMQLGRDEEAARGLRAAMGRMPDDYSLRDRLAWLLATLAAPSAAERAEALELAKPVRARSKGVAPVALYTLAAALSAHGNSGPQRRSCGSAAGTCAP